MHRYKVTADNLFVFMHTNTFNNDPFYSNGASARFPATTNDTGEVVGGAVRLGADLQRAAIAYANTVVSKEWPAMAKQQMTFASNPENRKMWDTLLSVKSASSTQSTVEGQALRELGEMNQHRRIRQLQSTSQLPGVLWFVLIMGGLVAIGSSCMFGSISRVLHLLQVSGFSFLIALTLVAIADIDRPF